MKPLHFTAGISNDICGVFGGLFGVNARRFTDAVVMFVVLMLAYGKSVLHTWMSSCLVYMQTCTCVIKEDRKSQHYTSHENSKHTSLT